MSIDELKKDIIQVLEKRKYVNKKVNYEEFLKLYEPYRLKLSEQAFAGILGIGKPYLSQLKRDLKKNAIILKRIKVSQERKSEIEEELRLKGYSNLEINYVEFVELFSDYESEMIATNFAEILGISQHSLKTLKSQPSRKMQILITTKASEEVKHEIIEELKNKGYVNKAITYAEFLTLYETYRTKISKNEFAKVLSIDSSLSKIGKNKDKRIVILKTSKIDEKFKSDIIMQLKSKGYANKKIDYKEFLSLFELYKNDMTELEFSVILGISTNIYYKLKTNKTKAIILKTEPLSQELKEQIQSDLKIRGYSNKRINYKEFLELFQQYKADISETDFTIILNISESAYRGIKYNNRTTEILKEKEKINVNEEEIRSDYRQKGYSNKLITYDEFLVLYKPYKNHLREQEFADILGMSFYGYKNLKRGTKARILEFNNVSEENKEKIRERLIEQKYANKLITYQEFLELYKPYKEEMTDEQFAEILGISFNGLNNLKKTHDNRVIILKSEKVSEEIIIQIRKLFKDRGYTNKKISYQEFLELYEPYEKEMTEKQFAEILNIPYYSLQAIKDGTNQTTIILQTGEASAERKKEIYINIKNNYSGQKIGLNEFLQLYEPYKEEMTKTSFAKILGISKQCYSSLIYYGEKVKILEDNYEEISRKIISELKERQYDGKIITNDEFKELYELYKDVLPKSRFVDILGISMKNDEHKYKINLKKQGIDQVNYILSFESRAYTRDELDEMCAENEITLYDLLEYKYKPYLKKRRNEIIENLLKKDQIYIGKFIVPNDFQEKYAEELLSFSNIISKKHAKRFGQYADYEDIASSSLIYTLYNKGELVLNSESDEEALDRIRAYIYVTIKEKYIHNGIANATISLDDDISQNDTRKRYEVIKSKDIYSPKETYNTNESIIEEMEKLYNNGMNSDETIDFMMEKYKLGKKELLNLLQEELLKRRTIKQTSNGKVYLGEEL